MAERQETESSLMHGDHWKPRSIIDGDLANFRKNGLSRGFDNCSRLDPKKTSQVLSENLLLAIYSMYCSMMGKDFFDKYYISGVGNPDGPTVDGHILTISDLHAIYNAWTLWIHVDNPNRIVEIGPGFGALASILRRLYPDAELVLVDLPEHKKILEFYLNKTVGMDGITITTELPDGADIVVALRCLMEMPDNEVNKYIGWAQENDVSWFYLINRYIKKNIMKFYPFDNKWVPFVSKIDYITGQLHEFLLSRVKEEIDLFSNQLMMLPPYHFGDSVVGFKGGMTGKRNGF